MHACSSSAHQLTRRCASPRRSWLSAAGELCACTQVTYISEPASSDDRLGINQLVPLLFTVLVLLSLMYAKS
jgi:hypothetical protein